MWSMNKYSKCKIVLLLVFLFAVRIATAQKTYFIDGYHGGIYGHYPLWQTQFMVDTLRMYNDWSINLEIEPETWDTVRLKDPEGYKNFQQLFKDNTTAQRMEFVNPAYAQSYLYTSSGESMIRQFAYGMKKIKAHFPEATFITYSSEEPCFTSALPQVLKSFGFKYAVLKNPNTCWGGYVKNYGGEIMNWQSADGTVIKLVPRYSTEALEKNSTWQTTAWNGNKAYYDAAFADGIKHPVAMCLQDAGWKNGRWLAANKNQSVYTTWRNYFEHIADTTHASTWRVSQEDIKVSLVWGSQVLQRIAQQVRVSENKIIAAEKMAAFAGIEKNAAWPAAAFDNAWRSLMLSQHHDCWIVPYNGSKGDTWADKVKVWTNNTDSIADAIINASIAEKTNTKFEHITVYNTLGIERNEFVEVRLPDNFMKTKFVSVNDGKKNIPAQITYSAKGEQQLVFRADVPAMGYKSYMLDTINVLPVNRAGISIRKNDNIVMETDLYKMVIDAAKGGDIISLVAKKMDAKEFIDSSNREGFNALRGNFYKENGFASSSVNKAVVKIIETGPFQIKLSIENNISGHSYIQTITMRQGEPRIDFKISIDWQSNVGIGEDYKQSGGYKATDLHKAFYNDTDKLIVTFPLNLKDQHVFVDAPFDVTRSSMKNTFFNTWDSIKNNTMLSWVDVTDKNEKYGFALLTDHTTNYLHSEGFPLGLVLQYSGIGLWGRDYSIEGPTTVNYCIIPHKGNWQHSQMSTASQRWNEPLFVATNTGGNLTEKSFIGFDEGGWQVSSFVKEDDHYLLRLFNAEADNELHTVKIGFAVKKAVMVQLNGVEIRELKLQQPGNNISLSIPSKGFVTVKIYTQNK